MLDFETPRGLRLNVSSLASPNFASSYTIGSVGVVDGSISYLYSSLPLAVTSRSTDISLHSVIPGYRHLQETRTPDHPWWWESYHRKDRVDRRGTFPLCSITSREYYLTRHNKQMHSSMAASSSQPASSRRSTSAVSPHPANSASPA